MADKKKQTFQKSLVFDNDMNAYLEKGSKEYAKIAGVRKISQSAFLRHIVLTFKRLFKDDMQKSFEK